MTVEAIFFNIFKLDYHNMGRIIVMRYSSVETFDANDTQTMGGCLTGIWSRQVHVVETKSC